MPRCTARIPRRAIALLVPALLCAARTAAAPPDEFPAARPSFAEPAISPDAKEIAFVSAGDIWTVPAIGGEARLLVSHPANETRPLYSPDGKRLAFVSSRTGNGDVYALDLGTGDVARLTYDDAPNALDAWSADGKWVYFSSTGQDIGSVNNDVYRVAAAGGTPMAVIGDRYANEFGAAASPDGMTLAFCAGGPASRDWWRRGHAHWDECQVWLMRGGLDVSGGDGKPAFEELTKGGSKDLWPMWSPDGSEVYCVSDRDGTQNLWASSLDGKARQLTQFKDGRVVWPTIARDGTIAFERNFNIWTVDPRSDTAARELAITLRGAAAVLAPEHTTFAAGFREMALSPDGRKLTVIVHGEVFAVGAKDGGRAVRVTHTTAAESNVAWARDSRRIAYVSERNGAQNVFLYDFADNRETQLTEGDGEDSTPRFSPDGKRLAFRRDGESLHVIDLATKKDVVIAEELDNGLPPFDDALSPMAWSPKGEWIAYIAAGAKGFDNVMVVPSTGGKRPAPVTFFANSGSNAVSWAPDGKSILFGTGQRTEDFQLAKIDLVIRAPTFPEDQFRGLFPEEEKLNRPGSPRDVRPPDRAERNHAPTTQPTNPSDLLTSTTQPATSPTTAPAEAATASATTAPSTAPATGPTTAAAKEPLERLSLRGVRQRTSLLSVGVDVDYQTISPDGKWAVIVGASSGKQNLYAYPLDPDRSEPAVLRQLTTTTGPKSHVFVAPDSKDVYFLDGGAVRVVNIDSRALRDVPVTAQMEVDFNAEKREVARAAWKYLKLNFYDPKLHGVDWPAARQRYFPHVAGSRTPEEMRRVLLLMVGELNASHLGIGKSGGRDPGVVGRLGLRFDRGAHERHGRFRIAEVVPQSPASVAGLKVGEYVLSIDDVPLDAKTNLDNLLAHKTGRKVTLTRSAKPDGEFTELAVRPIDAATERALSYRAWVEQNRLYVDRASKGRLGYVHLADMSKEALARLTTDLDARAYDREGVVIDVRGNLGGFVSPYALDVFARRGYLTIGRRGAANAPARTYVGQRALEAPTILVTNRTSVSDAENFTEGYRALGLGKVVGEPTAGGVIFTSETTLLDGTSMRIPYSKVTATRDGSNLERTPRPVDVEAKRVVGEASGGKDGQLDVAVSELLKQVESREKPKAAAAE